MVSSKALFNKIFLVALIISSYISFASHYVMGIEIDDDPVETSIQSVPPLIMFLLDDSSSMAWEVLTRENSGVVWMGSNSKRHLYFHGNKFLGYEGLKLWKTQWYGYNRIFYNPFMEYKPWPGSQGNANPKSAWFHPERWSTVTVDLERPFVILRKTGDDDYGDDINSATSISCDTTGLPAALETDGDHDVFKIVLSTSGDLTVRARGCAYTKGKILKASGEIYPNSFKDDCGTKSYCDRSCNPVKDENFYISLSNVPAGTYYIDVEGDTPDEKAYYTLDVSFKNGTCEKPDPPPKPDIIIRNAHYYVVDDKNKNNKHDPDEKIYLVNFKTIDPPQREFYEVSNKNDNKIAFDRLTLLTNPPAFLTTRTAEEDLQNFANWFSYYRKRGYAATAAVSIALSKLSEAKVGLYSINKTLNEAVVDIDTKRDDLREELFNLTYNDFTPLRTALLNVGYYFNANDNNNGGIGDAPWASKEEGGACQQAFVVMMTDAYWNGEVSPNVGNTDGDDGPPFADNYSNTLADVARKFYEEDLNSELDNFVPPNECDQNNKQHLVTYSISFGVEGELNPGYKSYHPCMLKVIDGTKSAPEWPNPHCNECPAKIDDLWHAAINGRGAYYSAANPDELIDAFNEIIGNIQGRAKTSAAGVAVNGDELNAGSIIFQTTYNSIDWTGNLKAFSVNASTGAIDLSEPVWEAKLKLLDQDWDSGRRIITSSGSGGKPFRFFELDEAQLEYLFHDTDPNTDDIEEQKKIIEFIRGKEIFGMRRRPKIDGKVVKLGDLVHSAPVLVNNTVFVGGNDGMLHAFNAQTGEERFAFIPNSVFPHLAELTDENYSHRFYVDLPSTVVLNVKINGTSNQNVLVGGLGAGGKGYFALNITDADTITDTSNESADVAPMFLWEYPRSGSDPDLGVSLSKVSIVQTYSSAYPYVAIFGNGYNSDNGHAVLYILDLAKGNVIKKIDTQVGDANGLSTPAVVDVDGDFKADYIYAGDLKGNLWKFDIRSSNTSEWKIAFSEGSTPRPLFTAKDQPITSRPDVMLHCAKHGFMVVFGTGKYFSKLDRQDTSTQTIYGIWDYGDPDVTSEYVGSFDPTTETFTPASEIASNNVELLKQTIINTQTVNGVQYRTFSDNQANWSTEEDINGTLPDPKGTASNPAHVGWYVNLGGPDFEGERVTRDMIIRNGKAIIITVIPSQSPCSAEGRSVLYEADACDGSRLENPVFDVNEDDNINNEDNIFISRINEKVPPTGRTFDVPINIPAFMQIPVTATNPDREEFKYLSTSDGTIIRIREPGDFTGIYYWIEW